MLGLKNGGFVYTRAHFLRIWKILVTYVGIQKWAFRIHESSIFTPKAKISNTCWGPMLGAKIEKNRLKLISKIDQFFDWFFNRFLIDFGSILELKIGPKSIKKLIKKLINFLIDFLIHFIRNLKDFRPLRSSKMELSCTRELNFHKFEILVSRWIFDRFWGQLGSPNQLKIN